MSKERTPNRKQYIEELDIFRGLAFLAVVMQHVLGIFNRQADAGLADSAMMGMLFNAAKFAVPAFVFVSGMVLFYNYPEKVPYGRFVVKRFREIFVPYMIWTALYWVVFNGMPSLDLSSAAVYVRHVLLGTGAYHLWFVVMLFPFYLLYPLLLKGFQLGWRSRWGTGWKAGMLIALAAIAYTFLMWLSSSYIPSGRFQTDWQFVQMAFVEYRSRNFLFYFFYFLLGGIAAAALYKWRAFVLNSVTWNSFLFAILFVWVGVELMRSAGSGQALVNLNYSTSLKPSMFFYTVSEILLMYGLSLAIVKKRGISFKWLRLIGQYSYGAYLVHALILHYVAIAFSRWAPFESLPFLARSLGVALGTVCAVFGLSAVPSVAAAYGMSRLPFGIGGLLAGSAGTKGKRRRETAAGKEASGKEAFRNEAAGKVER